MKKFALLIPALLLVACSGGLAPGPTPSPQDLATEEVAVYAALLQARYPEASLVLMDQTNTGTGGVAETASTLEYVLKETTGLQPDTAASFQVRNDAAYPLAADMDIGLPYVLLSTEEMREIFDVNQDGWTVFYNRYPEAPGTITLSRVGFNASMDQALVYIGNQAHWLAGAGYFILLEKVEGVWTIDQEVMVWIS